jgi:hypothetical protein
VHEDLPELTTCSRALFNASITVFDPYKNKTLDIISFPGISEVFDSHGSGVHWDERTNLLSVVIDAQPAFLTGGANVSGDYWLIKYDPIAKRELWRTNLTATTKSKYGGFQDVTVDKRGFSYVVGTYPKSILRVSPNGKDVDVWYPPQTTNTTVHGFTGITSVGDTLLVVDSNGVPETEAEGNSLIWSFDMRDKKGRPVLVPRTPNRPLGVSDAIHLPPRYGGKVALVALDLIGVQVLRSRDGWRTAEDVGRITSDFPAFFARILPATVQIGQNQFMIGEYFPGQVVPGTKTGNQSDFPMFDITAQLDAMLA